jgi:hypothetical protein
MGWNLEKRKESSDVIVAGYQNEVNAQKVLRKQVLLHWCTTLSADINTKSITLKFDLAFVFLKVVLGFLTNFCNSGRRYPL